LSRGRRDERSDRTGAGRARMAAACVRCRTRLINSLHVRSVLALMQGVGRRMLCALGTTCVLGRYTRQPVETRSECRATHYTLATALAPLPQRRGLPQESPLQCLRACRLGTRVRTSYNVMSQLSEYWAYVYVTRYSSAMVRTITY
jgi:hypothetical protein